MLFVGGLGGGLADLRRWA